ncbi:single-stranded DNA-binding protein [Streptomyces sp. NPDC001268]|uniref:single-stranded DNA-binding protein n=1 Tax=Streptomyces sp. NPDC001268 TaxID=3364553 RepID=UPI0036B68E75
MSDVMVTLVGNVATAVEYRESATGGRARFRFAVPSRRWDRQRDAWTDGPTSFYTVWAWRALGANLAASVGVGEPLVVHGRLRVREEEWEGKLRTSVDVDAMAAGHDLTRGTSAFRRVTRTEAPPAGQPAVAAPGMGPPPPVPSAVPMPPTAPTTPTTSATSTGAASSTVPATGVHGSPTPSAPSPLSHPLEAAGADAFEPVPSGSTGRAAGRSRAASATVTATGSLWGTEVAATLPASAHAGSGALSGTVPGARSGASDGVLRPS